MQVAEAVHKYSKGSNLSVVPLYGGASARPFVTHHNALDLDLVLRIATEICLLIPQSIFFF